MRKVFLACAFLFLAPSPALALKVAPFKLSIPVQDISSSKVFRIRNNSADPAAVQVSVAGWRIAPDGQETDSNAEDDFIIFPAQVVLAPHESRAVRIQYIGKTPKMEKAYRLIAAQLPIDLKGTPPAGSAVRFMLRFKAALYITPAQGSSDVKIVRTAARGENMLRLTLANTGTIHTLLRKAAITLSLANGQNVVLRGKDLKALEGENIHAGDERFFDVSLPQAARGKNIVSATLMFNPAF